jgi:hypothetical protein
MIAILMIIIGGVLLKFAWGALTEPIPPESVEKMFWKGAVGQGFAKVVSAAILGVIGVALIWVGVWAFVDANF